MTDDMFPFPGQDHDLDRPPGEAFAGGFGDEPPLIDMVPRALAVYERGRRRCRAAGAGGAVAAVTVTALVAAQLLGGGTGAPDKGSEVAPGGVSTPSGRPSAGQPSQSPVTAPTQSPTPSGGPCDRNFTLHEQDTTGLPVPDQAAAKQQCEAGVAVLTALIPGHTWAPIPDPYHPLGGTAYLPDAYAADGAADTSVVGYISAQPSFAATCVNGVVWGMACRSVTLAGGAAGAVVDAEHPGDKVRGGYDLGVDLPGGRQFRFILDLEAGRPGLVSLEEFTTLVQTGRFAEYLKQCGATVGM